MKKLAGMTWPEDGNPGFLCVLVESREALDKTMEIPKDRLEVVYEYESGVLYDVFEEIRKQKWLLGVYAPNDSKYQSFVREYYQWRRDTGCTVPLKSPNISSFEAGIMKIKSYVAKKSLVFSDTSIVKAQLRSFSKLSIKDEGSFFAVSALANVINSFTKRTVSEPEKEPNIRGWY